MKSIRYLVLIATAAITAAGLASYWAVAANSGAINIFELISLPLFGLLFGWIAFSSLLAVVGFAALARDTRERKTVDRVPPRRSLNEPVATRTAVLMPIYNESPQRVFAGVRAMIESLRRHGVESQFAFYILSDSTDPETWIEEEVAWSELRESLSAEEWVFYRHRSQNTARKAGNIADFVARWGGHHELMIVLDADSLVTAETMLAMVDRMRSDERLGILQVPPVPIGRNSLFARLQQFSAGVYGAIFVKGFALWAGDQGNYWGHNAIIRIDAFRDHCDLPVLPGQPPLGGEILSHDFVEAALMVRSGWKVQLATDLGGSYEECPTTLSDYAQRDQRWCQGNLQHWKLVVAENFRPLSRVHFACGVMSYVASPLWILFTLTCVAGTVVDRQSDLAAGNAIASGALLIFAIAMFLLLLPKLCSVLLIGMDRTRLPHHGGFWRLSASVVFEIISSVLLSPIMAIYHSRFVLAVFRGANVRWNAQQRDERGVAWSEAFHQFIGISVAAVLVTAMLLFTAPGLLLWFSPLLAGLLLAIPLAVAMGSQRVGLALRNFRLLLTEAETDPPEICLFHQAALRSSDDHPARSSRYASWFEDAIKNPVTYALHTGIQKQTHAQTPMPVYQTKAVETAFLAHGIDKIPLEQRKSILLDGDTLRLLHLESQLDSPAN